MKIFLPKKNKNKNKKDTEMNSLGLLGQWNLLQSDHSSTRCFPTSQHLDVDPTHRARLNNKLWHLQPSEGERNQNFGRQPSISANYKCVNTSIIASWFIINHSMGSISASTMQHKDEATYRDKDCRRNIQLIRS